jgi:hypothetical protein
MCFSSQASFIAAGALSIISLLSIKQVRTKSMLPFALTPLFFGIQQAAEGFVWITLNNNDSTSMLHIISMYTFLFFAGMFWPTWVPLSLYMAETIHKRKRLLLKLVGLGIVVSVTLLYCWILQTPGAMVIDHHIDYPVIAYPFGIMQPVLARIISLLIAFCYGIATIIPFFISSIPYVKLLGAILGVGATIAYIFYLVAFPSVWCFFAAIGSIMVYFILRKQHQK